VKISICLPVFGRPRMLCQALHSILMQGYDDVELAVQDGNPEAPVIEDGQVKRVAALLGDRLNYSCGRDHGIFDAVNRCLRRVTGGILYFMCDDDLLCPGALEAVNAAFERERFGGPFWVYGQTISAHVSGRTQGIDGAPITYDQLLQGNKIGQPAVFWNRQMLELAGVFDTRFKWAADYDLWLRMWRVREPEFIGQTLGVHRHHDAQATRVNAASVEREARAISWRHRSLDDVVSRARLHQQLRRVYSDGIPESVN
jgi:glycosyltransferase involved in cell wall biosynthesis